MINLTQYNETMDEALIEQINSILEAINEQFDECMASNTIQIEPIGDEYLVKLAIDIIEEQLNEYYGDYLNFEFDSNESLTIRHIYNDIVEEYITEELFPKFFKE